MEDPEEEETGFRLSVQRRDGECKQTAACHGRELEYGLSGPPFGGGAGDFFDSGYEGGFELTDESGEVFGDFAPVFGAADGVLSGGWRGGFDGKTDAGAEAPAVDEEAGEDGVGPGSDVDVDFEGEVGWGAALEDEDAAFAADIVAERGEEFDEGGFLFAGGFVVLRGLPDFRGGREGVGHGGAGEDRGHLGEILAGVVFDGGGDLGVRGWGLLTRLGFLLNDEELLRLFDFSAGGDDLGGGFGERGEFFGVGVSVDGGDGGEGAVAAVDPPGVVDGDASHGLAFGGGVERGFAKGGAVEVEGDVVEGERAWNARDEGLKGFERDLLVFLGGAGGVRDCGDWRADAELGGVVGEGLELGESFQSAGDGGDAGGEGIIGESEADLGGRVAGGVEGLDDAGYQFAERFFAVAVECGQECDAHGRSIECAYTVWVMEVHEMEGMTRRGFLAAAGMGAVAQSRRPHLVLFLADDHGFFDSPVYGAKVVRTPNMERLAAEGLTFEHAFSGAAICIPSRAILMSGLCSHRNGATANGKPMKTGLKTLPSYMKELGYQVAHFGKSHFLPAENYKDWEAVPSEIKGEGVLNTDLVTGAVDEWLANWEKSERRPLCLIVCSHSPHVTWDANQGYDPGEVELPPSFVDTAETRAARAEYYTDVTKMDTQLGEVYASVRKRLGNNALFLYTSDNGAQWPFGKWSLYDAGIRLPMIATWPGVVRAASRTRAMVSFTDVLPTFMELAGGKGPAGIDGLSFAGVLRGRSSRHRDEIYASHTADNNGGMNCYPMRAVRTERWKYIRNLHPELSYQTHFDRGVQRDGRVAWDSWVAKGQTDAKAAGVVRRYHARPVEELYDVAADPHETRNLAGVAEHAGVLGELRGKVDAWMKGMGDEGEIFGIPRPLREFRMPV